MTNVIYAHLKCVKEDHTNLSGCDPANIEIHPILGSPANIGVSLPASDPKHLSDLLLGGVCYKVSLLIVNPDSKVIFALYQNQMHEGNFCELGVSPKAHLSHLYIFWLSQPRKH